MAISINPHEFSQLRRYIEDVCGVVIDDGKEYLVQAKLAPVAIETGCRSFTEFYRLLEGDKDPRLVERVVDAVTTRETLWFRDAATWRALRDSVLPELVERFQTEPDARLRIWSAACATGQEPYSFAMLVDESCRSSTQLRLHRGQVEIVATDISTSALFIAIAGRYTPLHMERGFSDEWVHLRHRYFTTGEDGITTISNDLKKMVAFHKLNLLTHNESLERFDVVLLRNTLIYFSDAAKRSILERVADQLTPGGLLIVGAAENVSLDTQRLAAVRSHGPTFYRLRRQ